MGDSDFHHQIEAMQQRLAVLQGWGTANPIRRAEAQSEAFKALHTTLEELHVADEALTAAHQVAEAERRRYQELFDFAPDGYVVTDEAGAIHEANRAAAAMLAVSQETLRGKPLVVFVAEGERKAFHTQLTRLQAREQVQDWEVRLQPHKGMSFPAAITVATVRDRQGSVVDLRWLLRDITARKQAEEALQHAHAALERRVAERTAELQRVNAQLQAELSGRQQMEEALLIARNMEALGVLAGGIAHDFNNLLTAILGNVSLAKMLAAPHEKMATLLTRAEAACQRAAALAQQLLTFATGGLPVRQTASLTDLIKESARIVVRGSNVRCVFALPDDLWLVEVDTGQMRQVFDSMLRNGDQAMPHGGRIDVRAENFFVGADHPVPLPPGRYVKVVLRDQGVGIPAPHLPKIFDPYFTTQERGSGLGLAIVYAILTKHQGHITVESKVGVGTTFSLYLPAAYGARSPQEDVEARPVVGTGKILVMDDEAMVRDLVVDMLTSLGYEVESACDGVEAIALYERAKDAGQPFAAVILDLIIPGGMGGKEAIATLRQLDPQVKVIVSSGYADDPVMADFQRYGCSGVVVKPYTVQGLCDVLQRVIPGSSS